MNRGNTYELAAIHGLIEFASQYDSSPIAKGSMYGTLAGVGTAGGLAAGGTYYAKKLAKTPGQSMKIMGNNWSMGPKMAGRIAKTPASSLIASSLTKNAAKFGVGGAVVGIGVGAMMGLRKKTREQMK